MRAIPASVGFYGFIGGETDQFYPALFRNTLPVAAPRMPEEGYHLTTDLANDCIAWMRTQKALALERPFFVHFAPGAALINVLILVLGELARRFGSKSRQKDGLSEKRAPTSG